MRHLPNTFIVGAPKSGTTYLAEWLASSIDVYAPPVKEPGFFMEEHQYRRGPDHCAAAYYPSVGDEKVVFDATPWYLYPASVPERIAEAVGTERTRIIVVLREPAARAVSMYFDQAGRYRETRSFAQVAEEEMAVPDPDAEVAAEAGPALFRHYVLCGRYAAPVKRYFDRFGQDQVLVILAEEMWSAPVATRCSLEQFLEIDLPDPPARVANGASKAQVGRIEDVLFGLETSESALRRAVSRHPALAGKLRKGIDVVARWNQTPVKYPPIEPGLTQRLRAFYRPANEALSELLGRHLEPWC